MTYQPDWIIEAMGLKSISPEEDKLIQVKKGPVARDNGSDLPVTRSRSGNYQRG